MPHRIIIINGPNINLLGEREKSQYGKLTFEELKNKCLSRSSDLKVEIDFYQSNIEGELVTKIQESRNKFDGIIINAAGFTHTSVAIRDALQIFDKTKIEFDKNPVLDRFNHQLQYSGIKTKYTMFPDFSWTCVDID